MHPLTNPKTLHKNTSNMSELSASMTHALKSVYPGRVHGVALLSLQTQKPVHGTTATMHWSNAGMLWQQTLKWSVMDYHSVFVRYMLISFEQQMPSHVRGGDFVFSWHYRTNNVVGTLWRWFYHTYKCIFHLLYPAYWFSVLKHLNHVNCSQGLVSRTELCNSCNMPSVKGESQNLGISGCHTSWNRIRCVKRSCFCLDIHTSIFMSLNASQLIVNTPFFL